MWWFRVFLSRFLWPYSHVQADKIGLLFPCPFHWWGREIPQRRHFVRSNYCFVSCLLACCCLGHGVVQQIKSGLRPVVSGPKSGGTEMGWVGFLENLGLPSVHNDNSTDQLYWLVVLIILSCPYRTESSLTFPWSYRRWFLWWKIED